MRKILILSDADKTYSPLFEDYGKLVYTRKSVEDCDLVVFTGGADVHPDLYGDKKLPSTHTDKTREGEEHFIFNLAMLMAIPMVGICRGMQFLNVMNGGALVQDIDNHTNCSHPITTNTGEVFDVTGDHHQMCLPKGMYEMLAYSKSISNKYEGGGSFSIPEKLVDLSFGANMSVIQEPEAIYWPNSNSLGVQYHPEWMEEESRGYDYFHELMNKYIFNQE